MNIQVVYACVKISYLPPCSGGGTVADPVGGIDLVNFGSSPDHFDGAEERGHNPEHKAQCQWSRRACGSHCTGRGSGHDQ